MLFFKKMKNRKKQRLTIVDMIRLEEKLTTFRASSLAGILTENDPAKKLKLKVEYVDEISDDIEAVLEPIDDGVHFGLIRVDKTLAQQKFAYMHEIVHYIFDVGVGNKVEKTYNREKKGKTSSHEEQETNYLTAAAVMDLKEIQAEIRRYDMSHPKIDEIQFVKNLENKYGQSKEAVYRRISEVRRLEGKI